MADKTNNQTTTTTNADASEKRVKLGFVPESKLSGMVGAKTLADYRKQAEAMSTARDALSKLKADMTSAICKKLNLGDPDTVDVSIQEDKAVLFRRPAEKKRVAKTAMVDLTSA